MIMETTTGTYAIDATRSRIRFDTSHSFGIGPVHGTFAVRDGVITVAADPARSTAGPVPAAATHPWQGRRAVGAWTKTSVLDLLANPKYTGYIVWNRRKRSRPERHVSGKVNPPSEWV